MGALGTLRSKIDENLQERLRVYRTSLSAKTGGGWKKLCQVSVSIFLLQNWSLSNEETSFQPSSMVCISVIIHITSYKFSMDPVP